MMNEWRDNSSLKLGMAAAVLAAALISMTAPSAEARPGAVVEPASQRGFSVLPVPQSVRDVEGFDPQASAGLFVGVHEFDDTPFPPVLFAADDAVDLAHLFALDLDLIDPSRVVLSLSGEPKKEDSMLRLRKLLAAGAVRKPATQAEIYRQLRTLSQSTSDRGLFVVAMATHGVANTDGDFLVGSDSLSWHLPRTGIAVSEVFNLVSEAPAPRRLVLVDACRERGSAPGTRSVMVGSQMSPSLSDAISQASGQVVLFGATHGGFAYDDPERGNGVFAASVIEGLSGRAETDDRYFITAGTLARYVQREVVGWIRRNRPEHVHVSKGISTQLEGGAAQIPLAFDPYGQEVLEEFQVRLAPALERLHKNIGGPRHPDNPITGGLYDQITSALHTDIPNAYVLDLLEAVESLDGSVHTQRSVAFVYQKYREAGGSSAPAMRPGRQSRHKVQRPVGRRQTPRLGDQWKDPVAGIDFVYLPRGSFNLGSPTTEGGRDSDEMAHRVTLGRGFWIAATEVTVLQFGKFVAETGYLTEAEMAGASQVWGDGAWINQPEASWRDSGRREEDLVRPVTNISWNDAKKFAAWLSRRTGKQVRLPTEAQWEFAARAGTRASTYAGNIEVAEACDSSELDEIAWYCGNSGMETHPVGEKRANAWGIHDMLGNAAEWVGDWFGQYPESPTEDPTGPDSGSSRVVRGGSSFFGASSCRAASRSGLEPDDHYSYLGFRVVILASQ